MEAAPTSAVRVEVSWAKMAMSPATLTPVPVVFSTKALTCVATLFSVLAPAPLAAFAESPAEIATEPATTVALIVEAEFAVSLRPPTAFMLELFT